MTDIAIGAAPSGARLRDLVAKGLVALATVFTNTGAAIITNRIIQAGTAPKLIAWGTGTTAAAVGNTDMQTESSETLSGGRVTGAESRTTVTNTNDNYQVQGTVTATGTRAITEAGLFDAQSVGATVPNANGNMLIHSVFSANNLSANDAIQFTFGLKMVPG